MTLWGGAGVHGGAVLGQGSGVVDFRGCDLR